MKILAALFGTHTQPEHRAAQRETWLKELTGLADYRYFLGEPEGTEPDVVYCPVADGPLWEFSGPVGHRTWILSRKAEHVAAYALQRGYDYVFKCDDDSYVDVPRWLASGFEQHEYSGSTDRHIAKALGSYHWAQGGSGFWLSRRALALIVQHGLRLNRAEDFAIGQLLAWHGIVPHHDDRYVPAVSDHYLSQIQADGSWITLHKINPTWMRRLHARFRS